VSNILTDGRTALLAALKADMSIAALVKTWWEFNRPLIQRFEVEPAACTAYALHPGPIVEPDERYNAAYDLRQQVIVLITSDGQVPDPCEELVMLTIKRVRACRDGGMLGLSADGLANLRAGANVEPWEHPTSARLMWQAAMTITLDWILFP